MHAAGHEVTTYSLRTLRTGEEQKGGGGQAVLVLQQTAGHLCVCLHGWGFLVFIFICLSFAILKIILAV